MLEGEPGKGGGAADRQGRNAAGSGGAAGHGQTGSGGGRQDGTAGEAAAEEEEETQKTPEFAGLRWEKGGKETHEALVDDEVVICFDVKNINNGETVKATIWEYDEDNEHDHVADKTGTVTNGKVAITWKVVYTPDEDDGSTSAKELKEKGYTLPEYHFVAEYDGVESEQGPVMEVKGWAELVLKHYQTKEPLANRKYTIFLGNGEKVEGITDEKGNVNKTEMAISERFIMIHEEE
jgi:hypothetical protein